MGQARINTTTIFTFDEKCRRHNKKVIVDND
jgi:hypothetical protein